MITLYRISCIPQALALLLFAGSVGATERFFTPPESPYIISPKEAVRRLTLSAGTVEAAQLQIDSARRSQPGAVLVIHLAGTLSVGSAPLRLGSRMCLVLDSGAGLTANADATASSLLQIDHAEFVSVSSSGPDRGAMDGKGRMITGIAVVDCGKVNLDHLSIRDCGVAAVDYKGRDAGAVRDAGSLTRCLIQGGGAGLIVSQTAGFMCLDNEFRAISGAAITAESARSVIAGNDLIGNQTGVISASDRGVLARNTFYENDILLMLATNSAGNLVAGNRSLGKAGHLRIGGQRNEVYDNRLAAIVQCLPGAGDNLLVNNPGLRGAATVPPLKYFNPPTFNHPHTNRAIVPGLGRFDLTLVGGTNRYAPADLRSASESLRQAKADHQGDVVVAHLQGYFISHEPAGLELAANTCVILDGSIRADLGVERDPVYQKGEAVTQVVRLSPDGYCSFSGGTLDGGHQVLHGINATNPSAAVIDGVTLKGAVRDGVRTKGRESHAPLFINGCTIADSGGRGIWLHVAGDIHAIGNTCVGNQQDGIDVDAHAVDCNVLFNICTGNRRHGVFIEEAIANNLVFGNELTGNYRSGVHVWNEEVAGNTGPNVVAANECRGNVKGLSVGGRAADRTACANFFFNNVCGDNRDVDVAMGNSHATNNFFSQTVIRCGADRPAAPWNPAGAYFTTPPALR
jgi:parallel beta-helix repeat protein